MSIKLNEEQSESLELLSGTEDYFVLKGYAGTGKTTLITHWIREVKKRPEDLPDTKFWRAPTIVLTAPTNKATNVLKEKAREINLPVDCSTIHSLLSLKMKWEDDKQILVQDARGDDTFGDYKYVVIDECSMLSEELMGYICRAQKEYGNKIIFMGDPCQLPPISEKHSRSFDAPDRTELTTIMRQGKGNKIMDLSIYLRELILGPRQHYPNQIFTFVDDKNIFYHPLAKYQDDILSAFAEDSDRDIRHVAWTNKVVDSWNDKIRDRIYGFDREEWTKGEQIVTTAPVMDQFEDEILFTTDTLLKIEADPEEEVIMEVPVWALRCKRKTIYVVRRDASKMYRMQKELLLAAAKKDRKEWRNFYDFMEAFAYIKPAHSLTVHRSQGSTFDDVYVSFENILANPNRKESLQCLYVAITRPRSRLFLV